MAGKLGSYPDRDSLVPNHIDPIAREEASDPLAELARLIGQGDPSGAGGRHERHSLSQSGDDGATSGADWAADGDYGGQHYQPDTGRYVPPSHGAQAHRPWALGRFFSGPAGKFIGFRADADDHPIEANEERYENYGGKDAATLPHDSTGFAPAAHDDHDSRYAPDEYGGGQIYSPINDREDDAASERSRGGLVVIIAVLSLAVLGAAGAFAYRDMFGGSMLPRLPPIIKAAVGPNKIMPSHRDSHATDANDFGAASAGSAEKLVKHEEPPVDVPEAPKAAPRVVSAIPIAGGSAAAAATRAPSTSAQILPGFPPVAASPGFAASTQPGATVQPGTGAAGPISAEPKRIHTVVIRSDQLGTFSAPPVAPQTSGHTAPRNAEKPRLASKPRTTGVSAVGGNGPLPLVRAAAGDSAAPVRVRGTAGQVALARAEQGAGTDAAPSSGGYAVQLTSQRSEADAKNSFQALRAKFPDQLGGREPIVRRADLGTKGVYYRALVGPFASMQEAARMCSSLKAAGAHCLVQRN